MRLSVVMPAYNEEEAIEAACEDVRRDVLAHVPDSELVVVNDGSRDQTGPILDAIAAGDGRIRPIHQANSGHGGALMTGCDAARGEHLFLIDSDRQIDLSDFVAMWNEVQSCDAVLGLRAERHDPALRLSLTKFVRLGILLLFGVWIRDANVPCKLLKRSLWVEARQLIPDGTLAPSLFLAIYIRVFGFDVRDHVVRHLPRTTGVGSIRGLKLFKFCLRGLKQLITFRWRLRRWPHRRS